MDGIKGLRRFRLVIKLAYDSLAWAAATGVATLLRYEEPGLAPWRHAVAVAAALAALYFVLGLVLRVVMGRAPTGSLEEMLLVTNLAVVAGLVVFAGNLHRIYVARSVPVGATLCFVVAAGLGRGLWRSLIARSSATDVSQSSSRVLVVGAGDAGRDLVGSMLREAGSEWQPVGFLDDDHAKRNLQIHGVRVLGRFADLADRRGLRRRGEWWWSTPPTRPNDPRGSPTRADDAGLAVMVLPPLSEQLRDPSSSCRRLRDVKRGGHDRSPAGRHRRHLDRPIHHQSPGAGRRRGRVDRFRTVPPARPVRPGRSW